MKIVVLGARGTPDIQGGVEKHCENLYPHLVKKGCKVIFLARKPYAKLPDTTYRGVKMLAVACPKNKYFEAFFHTLVGIFVAKRLDPDILHIHAIGPSLLIPLARFMGMRVVMTNHGPDYERKKWPKPAKCILKLGEIAGTRWANEIICVSKTITSYIEKKYKRPVTFIPNGVPRGEVVSGTQTLAQHGLIQKRYIIAVGRFVPEKGFDILLKAFEQVTLPEWKLAIVGDADHEDNYSMELKRQAAKDPRVVLTGSLSGTPLHELYSHAGLFVLPSYYEGLPIVLLEAMSYGLSCIASNIDANAEIGLQPDRYFTAGDVDMLAKKMNEFALRPMTEEEKKSQHDMIKKKYDWANIAEQTFNVYKKVLHD